MKQAQLPVEAEAEAGSAVSAWDDLIDRHLARQAVERGLSRNSLDAYAGDLRDFHDFCRSNAVAPGALDTAVLTAWLEASPHAASK